MKLEWHLVELHDNYRDQVRKENIEFEMLNYEIEECGEQIDFICNTSSCECTQIGETDSLNTFVIMNDNSAECAELGLKIKELRGEIKRKLWKADLIKADIEATERSVQRNEESTRTWKIILICLLSVGSYSIGYGFRKWYNTGQKLQDQMLIYQEFIARTEYEAKQRNNRSESNVDDV